MTNLNKICLPRQRRYNWKFVWRKYKNVALLLAATIILGLLLYAGEKFADEHHAKLDAINSVHVAELEYLLIKTDMINLANFGAPGWIVTDWIEGTGGMKR